MNYLDTILLELKTRLTAAVDYENSPTVFFKTVSTAYNANLDNPKLPLCEIILGREDVTEFITYGAAEALSREIKIYIRANYSEALTPQQTYTKAFAIVRKCFKAPNYNYKATMPNYVQSFDYNGCEQASINEQDTYIELIMDFKLNYISAMNDVTTGV